MRKYYLDNIRWATVATVVLYHVVYMFNAEGIPGVAGNITGRSVQYIDVFQYIVYPWIMTVLFIVSGISSRIYLESHREREYIKARTLKLLVPSTIGILVFQFVQGYINVSLSMVFEKSPGLPFIAKYLIVLASGIGVLWTLQVMWLYSLLLVLIRRIEKDRLYAAGAKVNLAALIVMAVPVWLSAQVLNTPFIAVYRLGLYLFMFLTGYFVMSHDEVTDTVKKYFILFLVIALALCAAFCIAFFGQNYADAPVNRTPLYTTYSWFACLAIIGGMAKYGDVSNRFTNMMNKRSFGLYVFHYLGISAVGLYIGRPRLLPAPLVYVLAVLAGFGGAFVLYEIISSIPFWRWAVLGIKKEKKNV